MADQSARIGEIIETDSLGFVAQRLQSGDEEALLPPQPPNLGSLVYAHLLPAGRAFAVVAHGTTTGYDRGRQAIVRTREDVADAAVYREHPHLVGVLRTQFLALLVGYEDGEGHLFRHLPPQPPALHYAVYTCTPQEVVRFAEDLRYLRLLLNATGPVPPEQLLAAHLREVYWATGGDALWLEGAARYVANLLKRDYDQLRAALEALDV